MKKKKRQTTTTHQNFVRTKTFQLAPIATGYMATAVPLEGQLERAILGPPAIPSTLFFMSWEWPICWKMAHRKSTEQYDQRTYEVNNTVMIRCMH